MYMIIFFSVIVVTNSGIKKSKHLSRSLYFKFVSHPHLWQSMKHTYSMKNCNPIIYSLHCNNYNPIQPQLTGQLKLVNLCVSGEVVRHKQAPDILSPPVSPDTVRPGGAPACTGTDIT